MSFERSGEGELHWMGRLSKSRCSLFPCPLKQVLAQFSELDSQCTLISQLDQVIYVCVEVTFNTLCSLSHECSAERDGHSFQKKTEANVFHMPDLSRLPLKIQFSNPVYASKSHIHAFHSRILGQASLLLS